MDAAAKAMFGETAMPELDLVDADILLAEPSANIRAKCIGDDAESAWRNGIEAGLAPRTWLDDPRRVFPEHDITFFCNDCGGRGATGYNYDDECGVCHGKGSEMVRRRVSAPTDLGQVHWMLGNSTRIEMAEKLVREGVRRLKANNPAAPFTDVVQWGRVRKNKRLVSISLLTESAFASHHALRSVQWDWKAIRDRRIFGNAPWRGVGRMHELTRDMLCVDVAHAWAFRAYAPKDSPMDPILALWELGLVVEELTSDAVILGRAGDRYLSFWRPHVPLQTFWG